MPIRSELLERAIANNNGIVNLQVVFVDIEKYSARSAVTQAGVIEVFTGCLRDALRQLTSISGELANHVGKNAGLSLEADVVKLPTGDGALVAFPYDAVADLHLGFAKRLLEEVDRKRVPCGDFQADGWCNCHPSNFGLRVGISSGVSIVYKDINDNYNVAGGVVNLAARVMDVGDSGQIIFTDSAHETLSEHKPELVRNHFEELKDIRIKRGFINAHQYISKDEPYINSGPPTEVALRGLLHKSDFKQGIDEALRHLDARFRQLDSRLDQSLGGRSLRGRDSIYAAVAAAISQAHEQLRVVRLGSRAAPDFVIDAIAERVNKGVVYDIAVILRPQDVSKELIATGCPGPQDASCGFLQNHAALLKLIARDKINFYRPRMILTDNPVCFDVILVDQQHVGLGFTRYEIVEDLENAIFFQNTPEKAADFVKWFDEVIRPGSIQVRTDCRARTGRNKKGRAGV